MLCDVNDPFRLGLYRQIIQLNIAKLCDLHCGRPKCHRRMNHNSLRQQQRPGKALTERRAKSQRNKGFGQLTYACACHKIFSAKNFCKIGKALNTFSEAKEAGMMVASQSGALRSWRTEVGTALPKHRAEFNLRGW